MEKPLVLESKTNSNRATPPYIQCDQAELDTLIAKFSARVDWADPQVESLNTRTEPSYSFVDDQQGNEVWDDDQEAVNWAFEMLRISPDSAMLIFVNHDSGDELFCVYDQAATAA